MKNDPAATSRPNQTDRAVRIAVGYERDSLRVLSRQTVSMRTPPSDPLQPGERESSFWFTVEDSSGNPLYRRVMDNPVRFDTETPTDDPKRPLHRVPLERPAGTFHLLVPVLARAQTVRVFSNPFDPKLSGQPAQPILEFPVFADETPGGKPPDRPSGGASSPG